MVPIQTININNTESIKIISQTFFMIMYSHLHALFLYGCLGIKYYTPFTKVNKVSKSTGWIVYNSKAEAAMFCSYIHEQQGRDVDFTAPHHVYL